MPTLASSSVIRSAAAFCRQAHVLADGLADLVADGQRRVEAGQRVLEDEPDLLAAQLAHVLRAELQQVDAVEQDRARDDPARRIRHEPRDRERRDALAAAGFADEAERLAVADVEADVVDRLDDAVGREEVGRQVADLEQVVGLAADARLRDCLVACPQDVVRGQLDDGRCVVRPGRSSSALTTYCLPLSFGSRASRRPSPRKVKPMSARAMAMAGKTHQVRLRRG